MRILLRLTGMVTWRYHGRLILAYVSMLGAVAFTLAIPRLLGTAIDEALNQQTLSVPKDRTYLMLLALAILGASLMRGFFDFGRTYLTDSLSQKVSYDIRNSLYDAFQSLSFSFHDREHTGNLMSKATADVEGVRRFINMGLVRSTHVVMMIVIIAILLFNLNWILTLMSLSFVPFLILRSAAVMQRLRRLWLHVQELMGEMVTVLQENLTGIRVVKAFAAEEYEKDKFASKTRELAAEAYKSDRLEGANSALMTLAFTLATGLILWYGGRQVIDGNLTPGELAQAIFYMSMLNFPIRMLAWIIAIFSRAISSGHRVFEVLDARPQVEERPNAREMPRVRGEVCFKDVTFAYDSVAPAVKHINLVAEPGQIIALMGAPGSGKSTVVHLIPHFYEISSGQINIDNVDIRDMTLASLRRNVGIVQQDVFLFSATIRDNIAYGAVDASFEEIVNAAKVAQLHDFIESLPDGYDTWVGERGATLSGGQRQRLAIARTLLLDPPILILDDSTSSVDVETEHLIRQALAQAIKGRTTFVIAHRMSTVHNADLILVLKDGEIVERGTHSELLAQKSIYRGIYELQLRPQEEIMLEVPTLGDGGGDN